MAANKLDGKITYVNHEKNYVMVEYEAGGKKRVVKGKIPAGNNTHSFVSGDIIFYYDLFFFQQFLHAGWCAKMCFTREHTISIHNTLRWYNRYNCMCSVHSPAYHSGTQFCTQVSGNE